MRLLPSLILSIFASVLGSYLLRQLTAVSAAEETGTAPQRSGTTSNVNVMVLVIPVMGNSNNRFGGVRSRGIFGFGKRRHR